MPWPSRGSVTSLATANRSADRVEHVAPVRDDVVLHHRCERQRREPGADALDRCVQVVEGAVLDNGGELSSAAVDYFRTWRRAHHHMLASILTTFSSGR